MALSNAAFASTTERSLTQVIEAMFGVQPGHTILKQLAANTETSSLADVANFLVQFSDDATDEATFANAIVANLGITTAAGLAAADVEIAVAYVENALTTAGTANWGLVVLEISEGFAGYTADETFGAVATSFNQSVISSLNYSLDAANTEINAGGATTTNFALTAGQDNLTGTNAADFFAAYIFDNQNTAQSGDVIHGGSGEDTLFADIGESQDFAITLHTDSVEKAVFRAEATDNGNVDTTENNLVTQVQIDAERMVATDHYESNNSRADLVIEDVRIERQDAYGDNNDQITQDITIAMVSTDPGDVDFGVYFDHHSLVKEGDSTTNSIKLTVGNQLEIKDFDAAQPLLDIPYTAVGFLVNDVLVAFEIDLTSVTTYDEMWAAMELGFNAEKAQNILLSDATLTRSEGTDSFFSRDGEKRAADEYFVTVENSEVSVAETGWIASAGLPSNNAFSANVEPGGGTVSSKLITSTILLDDVGRGSMGGDLIVGGLSIGRQYDNVQNVDDNGMDDWDIGHGTSNSKGVERFNITVDRNSQLQEINSTNNTLQEVYIVNGEHNGNLVVAGDENGDNNLPGSQSALTHGDIDPFIFDKGDAGFTDVRVIDASAMQGMVHLNAELTGDVVAKYMDIKDTAAQAAADNQGFMYTLGTNNDMLHLEISNENLAAAGTTTREDFFLDIDGAAGNDKITTIITDGVGTNASAWYVNSKINANLTVNGGSGDDTIRTIGAGDFNINAGSGNDTVYANNDGNQGAAPVILEKQTLTFGRTGDLDTQGQVTVTLSDGQSFTTDTLVTGMSATAVAAAVYNKMAGAANVDVTLSGDQIMLTYHEAYAANQDVANATISTIATDAQVAITEVTNGTGVNASEAGLERITINTADINAAEAEITFTNDGAEGTKVTVTDTDNNGTITAFEVAQQIAAHNFADYTLDTGSIGISPENSNNDGAGFNPSLGEVYLVANEAGAKTDLSIASPAASVGVRVQGFDATEQVDGVAEVQKITVEHGADRSGSITLTIDNVAHNVSIPLGNEADVAATIAAYINNSVDGATAEQGATGAATANEVTVTWSTIGNHNTISMIDGALISSSVQEMQKGVEASTTDAATWVLNTDTSATTAATEINDLQSNAGVHQGLLYNSTVTVTLSGATNGYSGVINDFANAYDNGFESKVTIPMIDTYYGTDLEVNQAIKEAINDDAVLSKLLVAKDGPAHTLVIESLIDGRMAAEDLEITISGPAALTTAELTAVNTAYRELVNDSSINLSEAEALNAIEAHISMIDMAGAYTTSRFATNAGIDIAGNTSVSASDNTINLGSGDDVVVLGTDVTSNDTLVFTDASIGNNTVVNFGNASNTWTDGLDFTAYLGGLESNSGSTVSQSTIATTWSNASISSGHGVEANEVVIFNDFAAVGGETWSGLTGAELLSTVQGGTNNYANISAASLDVADTNADLVGTTIKNVVLIENDTNDGEYKVFETTATGGSTDAFTAITLLGTIDFGNTITVPGNMVEAIVDTTPVVDVPAPADTTAPTIISAATIAYDENQTEGAVIGTVVATDDTGVVNYAMSANDAFQINAAGQVSLTAAGAAGAANDFETLDNTFAVNVNATDAAGNVSAMQTLTLNVNDVAESRFDSTVDVTDLSSNDASTGNVEFNLVLPATGQLIAGISSFGNGDALNIEDPDTVANFNISTVGTTQIDFIFGDVTDFDPVWGVSLSNVDAALVTAVDAAANNTEIVGLLDTAWGDWLI